VICGHVIWNSSSIASLRAGRAAVNSSAKMEKAANARRPVGREWMSQIGFWFDDQLEIPPPESRCQIGANTGVKLELFRPYAEKPRPAIASLCGERIKKDQGEIPPASARERGQTRSISLKRLGVTQSLSVRLKLCPAKATPAFWPACPG
jgi:hypothetical protein